MPVSRLNKLIDAKLAAGKIRPDDAREILGKIEKDAKFTPEEISALKRLASLPKSKFKNEDEYIPNPYDPEDGVTIKAEPKRWINASLELATAKLEVRSTVPGVSIELSRPKRREEEDFGEYMSRDLAVTFKGKTVPADGTIDFTYGRRHVKLPVKQGTPMEKVYNRLESAIVRAEGGTLSTHGWFDSDKAGAQKIVFEVL